MLIQSFTHVLIIGDYYLNLSRYQAQCENKAKVALHCNGKCQMTKKLKAEDDREKKNPERRVQNQNEFFLFNRFTFTLAIPQYFTNERNYPFMVGKSTIARPHTIFRPPSV